MNYFWACALVALPVLSYAQLPERLDRHVQSYVDKGEFSGAVLVARDGEILLEQAYGFADKGNGVSNTPETQFLIGSTTKSFTAVTALQLAEKGHLDLHAPISTYLPYLDSKLAEGMTMHVLLKQLSGLPSSLERFTVTQPIDIDHDRLVEVINSATLRWQPGTKYGYSNVAYNLAAAVLCEVSGMDYSQLISSYTFEPLGMNHSGVERNAHLPSKKAIGYDVNNGTLTQAEPHDMAYAMGSGDIYSTVGDLFKWDRALNDDQYLSPDSRRLLFDGADEKGGFYGYGFRIIEYKRADGTPSPGTLARHGGSMHGYLANVHRYMEDDITVIVLGNIRPFPIRDLCFELKELVIGRVPGERNHE